MAHVMKLGALTEELVTLLTSTTVKSDPTKFSIYRESALRSLRHHNYARTNQFDVTSHLDGLEEKFRVYNEDPLADALRERLDTLERKKIKWGAEVLHLLIELSDKPVSNSSLEALDFLRDSEPNTGPPLQWTDLAADDPLLRDKIWNNVDFGAESSGGEDGFEDTRSESSGTDTTAQSSIEDELNRRLEEYTLDTVDKEGLEMLRQAQFWKQIPNVGGIKLETVKKPITELQAIREVAFMLLGLPTALFEIDKDKVLPSKGYALKHASSDTFHKLLQVFADNGSSVAVLRYWVNRSQSIPLMQTFQNSISERLSALDVLLSIIQQRLVAIEDDVVVSLLRVQGELEFATRALFRLSKIIEQLEQERYPHAFRYLELLYDEACTSQMAGDDPMYAFMGEIFFDCFQVYLRPLRTWMEDGELSAGDNVFFVSETSADIGPPSIWQSRYKIRQTQAGVLHAPRFLRAAANKIFTTGKSVVVLKHLRKITSLQSPNTQEPILDFVTVCDPSRLQLASFPELFDVAFDAWVQSKHHLVSSRLRATLFDSCGLHNSLDAVSSIYFMSNGITAATFTNSIFDKLDILDVSWNDRFTLTELARTTFGSLSSVSPDRFRIHLLNLPRRIKDVAKCRRSVKTLAAVEMKYNLSWPIQIILTPTTMSSYQRVFTFLLQIRRSSHVLSRQRLIDDVLTYTNSSDERALYYFMRHRFIWFTQTLYYYLTSLVIEPDSLKMQEQLRCSEDVDAMIEAHATFVKSIIDKALLGIKLELIHKTIVKILDMSIKLEDAQAANEATNKESTEQQQGMMDLSMVSLGLHTPKKRAPEKPHKVEADSTDDEDEEKEVDVDLSILSSTYENEGNESYVEKLRMMKADFDRLGRFVASGLRGVARAGGGDATRSWDVLGEMLEFGFESGSLGYR
ncbi:Gamma-tubulin complex component 6 [Hyphodiscus hymeniophilus]|uniref:Spindle pole body component n=1 Tax=Hyphodiscus hymeniophilus TaxID=353542 RepID=A0A9P6VEU6_9HELO|nr:Gamma-tubulin complex component 6 [Hyphodiscus hymeniophilus]